MIRLTKDPVIKEIQRISKPGLRKYSSSSELPRILNGLGIAIVSTSHGVMTGKQAQAQNVGGEVLCYVYLKKDERNVKNRKKSGNDPEGVTVDSKR